MNFLQGILDLREKSPVFNIQLDFDRNGISIFSQFQRSENLRFGRRVNRPPEHVKRSNIMLKTFYAKN